MGAYRCAPPPAAGRSRTGPRTGSSCPPLWPLFEGGPALFLPALYGFLVPLVGPAHRFLQAQPQLPNQPTYVRRVVAHAGLFSYHLGHPFTGPHPPSEPVCWRASGQKSGQSSPLLLAQARWRARRRSLLETFCTTTLACPPHPLAHSPLGNAQGVCYLPLALQPCCLSSKALRRLPSRQSAARLDAVFFMQPIIHGFRPSRRDQ